MFEKLAKDLATGNMGGNQSRIIYGRHADVVTWPTLTVVVGKEGESTGSVIMAAATKAFEIIATEETVDFKIAFVGEKDGKSQKATLTFLHPKLRAKVLAFMNAIGNEDVFFIVSDNNGTQYLMGDAQRGASLDTGEATTGNKFDSKSGLTCTFSYNAKVMLAYMGVDPVVPVI